MGSFLRSVAWHLSVTPMKHTVWCSCQNCLFKDWQTHACCQIFTHTRRWLGVNSECIGWTHSASLTSTVIFVPFLCGSHTHLHNCINFTLTSMNTAQKWKSPSVVQPLCSSCSREHSTLQRASRGFWRKRAVRVSLSRPQQQQHEVLCTTSDHGLARTKRLRLANQNPFPTQHQKP